MELRITWLPKYYKVVFKSNPCYATLFVYSLRSFSVYLRGDFLQNRVLGAQNQSDARMRN